MIDPTDIVEDVTSVAKKAMDNQQTERLKIDNTSPFMLPHLIRPILALWSAATYTGAQIYCLYSGLISGLEVMSANSAVMLGIIGFYFNSRRNEKINAKKTEAAIVIEKIRAKADIRSERRAARKQKNN